MPNPGYPFVRQAVADSLGREHDTPLTQEEIIMTCGAAGGLNVILKTLLDAGDEVLTPAPFFVEYRFLRGKSQRPAGSRGYPAGFHPGPGSYRSSHHPPKQKP